MYKCSCDHKSSFIWINAQGCRCWVCGKSILPCGYGTRWCRVLFPWSLPLNPAEYPGNHWAISKDSERWEEDEPARNLGTRITPSHVSPRVFPLPPMCPARGSAEGCSPKPPKGIDRNKTNQPTQEWEKEGRVETVPSGGGALNLSAAAPQQNSWGLTSPTPSAHPGSPSKPDIS